ncbi:MAG: biopolymer transporter ExbD [Myxococcales bacterium]|jgi:biopolymer transport protein ExbD|nr:biopolymer transporter ExbD [Myxococcales bacterium]
MAYRPEEENDQIITEINMTPFVDVVLVVLIIFIVTATYIVAQSIPVDLPEAATGEDVVTTLAVSVLPDGQLFLDGEAASEAVLTQRITQAQSQNAEASDVRVVIAADKSVSHGRVVHIIDLVRQLGVSRFAINIQSSATPSP